jgi:GH24 family phage-related lysozyme (muramidase)
MGKRVKAGQIKQALTEQEMANLIELGQGKEAIKQYETKGKPPELIIRLDVNKKPITGYGTRVDHLQEGDVITPEENEKYFEQHMKTVEKDILRNVGKERWDSLPAEIRNMIRSGVYNVGSAGIFTAKDGGPTNWFKALQAGDKAGMAGEWDWGMSQEGQGGLKDRRMAELEAAGLTPYLEEFKKKMEEKKKADVEQAMQPINVLGTN